MVVKEVVEAVSEMSVRRSLLIAHVDALRVEGLAVMLALGTGRDCRGRRGGRWRLGIRCQYSLLQLDYMEGFIPFRLREGEHAQFVKYSCTRAGET